MKLNYQSFVYFFLFIASIQVISAQTKKEAKLVRKANKNLEAWKNLHLNWDHVGPINIDSIALNDQTIEIFFTTALSYLPIREHNYEITKNSLKESLGRKFKNYRIKIITDGHSLETLII